MLESGSLDSAFPKDASSVLELLASSGLPLEGISGNLEGFLVIRDAGAGAVAGSVVGSVAREDYGDLVLLRSLAVNESARGRGLGAKLVREFLRRARADGKVMVYLLTTTAPGFFERFGFATLPIEEMPAAVRASKEFAGCAAANASAMVLDLRRDDLHPLADGDEQALKESIKKKYGAVASRTKSAASSCCGPKQSASDSVSSMKTQVTRDLYTDEQAACLPVTAKDGSRGCGNPAFEIDIRAGETVLDLGSGAGADVFLAASRVGPNGKVYGLDMTDEMLAVAEEGRLDLGLENVEFVRGEIEQIPLPDQAVDVVISNCVISLVSSKDRAFQQIARVLRPGGRISISDIVSTSTVPEPLRHDLDLWLGCLGGAITIDSYRKKLETVGFKNIAITIKRVYDLPALLGEKVKDESQDAVVSGAAAWSGQLCAAAVTAERV